MIEPLNDLSTIAAPFGNYRLANKSAHSDSSVASEIHRMQERLDVQLKTHVSSEQDPIEVSELLAHFITACGQNGATE